MKKIEAIISSSKFEAVRKALSDIGIDFFTYSETTGVGNEMTNSSLRQHITYSICYMPRQLLSIIVHDENLQKAIDCIHNVARTGVIGDGKIFVSNVLEA